MPNWCNNHAVLTAPCKEDIDNLLQSLQTEGKNEKFFNLLRPRPEDKAEHWYEWNCENWGTKWDTEPHSVERIDDVTIDLSFDTAWSPPTELYNFLVDEGWYVTAKYHEPGMGFVGFHNEDGDSCWEYSFDDENTIDDIPEDLVEWAGIRYDLEYYKEMNEQENHSGDEDE